MTSHKNVRTLRDIPLKLSTDNWPEIVEVRGEAYMEREAFARFNAQRQENGEAAFANPRNATAGSLKLLRFVADRTPPHTILLL